MDATGSEIIPLLRSESFEAATQPGAAAFNRRWIWTFPSGLQALAKAPREDYLGPGTDHLFSSNEATAWLMVEALGWNDLVAPTVSRWWEEQQAWVSVQVLWESATHASSRLTPSRVATQTTTFIPRIP